MAERKQTPDILGEILGEVAATAAPARAVKPGRAGARQASAHAATARAATPQPAAPVRWEHLIVSFQEHNGWRPRYANGEQLEDWTGQPVIHEYADALGAEGWELAGASSGGPLYGTMDTRQLYFKRVL